MIVSSAKFNRRSGAPVVWAVPVAGGECDPTQLTNLDRRLIGTRTGGCDAAVLRQTLRFLHWGFVGDGPFWDATDEQRRAHTAAAASAERDPAYHDKGQGDVVVDDEGLMLVVLSGPGFNTAPDNDTRWAMIADGDGLVHPHLLVSRTLDELHPTPMRIPADSVPGYLDLIVRKILGVG